MDPFAHAISGALLGRAARPAGENWRAFAGFGVLAAMCPDVDAPIALFGAEAWSRWHQLFTHSLLGLAWLPLAVAALPFRFAPWTTRFALAGAGWLLHNLLDLCARWPVPVLWPFSDARWSFSLLDADFSWRVDMLLLVGLAATLWDPALRHARWIVAGTALVAASWLLTDLPT